LFGYSQLYVYHQSPPTTTTTTTTEEIYHTERSRSTTPQSVNDSNCIITICLVVVSFPPLSPPLTFRWQAALASHTNLIAPTTTTTYDIPGPSCSHPNAHGPSILAQVRWQPFLYIIATKVILHPSSLLHY